MASRGLEIGDEAAPNLWSLWRWYVGVSLLLVGLTAVPVLLGYLRTPSDWVYTGLVMNADDSQSYLAKMRQGANGAWGYTIPFTPEPHEPAFVGLFYIFWGQVAGWLGVGITAVYHTTQLFFALLLFFTLAWFVGLFFPPGLGRRVAFLLAATGSGLGWLLFLLRQPYWLGAFPVDFKQPEADLFFTALTFPHMALGTVALLVYVGNLVGWQEKRPFSFITTGGMAALLLGIVQPFLIFVPLVMTLLLGMWGVWGEKRPFFPTAARLAAPLVVAAPLFAYYGWVLYTNPVFRAWDVQAVTPLAPWPHYLVSYGPWLLLALLGGWRTPRRCWLLWLWPLAVLLLLPLPLRQPRRLVQGMDVALALLATATLAAVVAPWLRQTRGWHWLLARPRYSAVGLTRLLLLLLLATMGLSNLYVWASMGVTAGWQQPDLLFRPRDEWLAVVWLGEKTAVSDTVLAAYQTGNWVAARAGNRVLLGHWAETMGVEAKETAVLHFFAADTADSWRRTLLEQYQVQYVWYGPREQMLGKFDPAQAAYLQPVYHNGTITLYVVEP